MLTTSCVRNVHFFFFFQAEDGIRDYKVTGVQTCALPISPLMSLTGWIAYLRENPGTTGVELAEHLQADAERLERVAKRFERIGRPARREPVGLGALAERVGSDFRPRLPTLASPAAPHLPAAWPWRGASSSNSTVAAWCTGRPRPEREPNSCSNSRS